MTSDRLEGVSFVIPVYNGERWLEDCLRGILAQADGRTMEVLAVDDGSRDGSLAILERHAADGELTILAGPERGAAAAVNVGIRAARQPIVCQVDQDVILGSGWLQALTRSLEPDRVAAAQGRWISSPGDPLLSRVSGLDLDRRYRRLRGGEVDQVCTGNVAYRRRALLAIGLFDESFGYGYDNDLSYRLIDAGYRLIYCPQAVSEHRWPSRWTAYLRHQFGVAYGRLDLIAKHPGRARGDRVSGPGMILHAAGTVCSVVALVTSGALAIVGGAWRPALALALGLLAVLLCERMIVGLKVARERADGAALLFPWVHLVRDLIWAGAAIIWGLRRLAGGSRRPEASMPRRGPAE